MGDRRSIRTKFWDDTFIRKLTSAEKLTYLYLLTAPITNLCGVYEISIERISFDTGQPTRTIRNHLERFGTIRKAFYKDGFIIIPNFIKHQRYNPNMKISMNREIEELPIKINEFLKSLWNGSKPFEMVTEAFDIEEKGSEGKKKKKKTIDPLFQSLWERYPIKGRIKRKISEDRYLSSVKSDVDRKNIELALENYIYSDKVKGGYVQNASTWFNDWQSWVDIKSERVVKF